MLYGKARQIENNALTIRKMQKIGSSDPFDPYKLAKKLGITVIVDLTKIRGLSSSDLHLLLEVYSDKWSGGGVEIDGKMFVVLNPTHNEQRMKSTLMEEICHFLLDHKPTFISTFKGTEYAFRDYNKEQEKEAFSVGAATLIPYLPLNKFIEQKKSAKEISDHFLVSEELVKFRIKITGLWSKYIKSAE